MIPCVFTYGGFKSIVHDFYKLLDRLWSIDYGLFWIIVRYSKFYKFEMLLMFALTGISGSKSYRYIFNKLSSN